MTLADNREKTIQGVDVEWANQTIMHLLRLAAVLVLGVAKIAWLPMPPPVSALFVRADDSRMVRFRSWATGEVTRVNQTIRYCSPLEIGKPFR